MNRTFRLCCLALSLTAAGVACSHGPDSAPFLLDASEDLPAGVPGTSEETRDIVLFDADGDGDLDLFLATIDYGSAASPTVLRLLNNDGTGRFTEGAGSIPAPATGLVLSSASGDVDGDGDADLVCGVHGGPDAMYLNEGAGVFTIHHPFHGIDAESRDILLADFNGDSALDVAISGGQGLRVFLNFGNGVFSHIFSLPELQSDPSKLLPGDLDGDGVMDLVWLNGAIPSLVLKGSGDGSFLVVQSLTFPSFVRSGVLADFSGDGRPDLLALCRGGLAFLGNDGAGNLASDSTFFLPLFTDADPREAAVADLDLDGDPDLYVAVDNPATTSASSVPDGRNRVLVNINTSSGFSEPSRWSPPRPLLPGLCIACGDVDGDGDADFLLGNALGQGVQLILNCRN